MFLQSFKTKQNLHNYFTLSYKPINIYKRIAHDLYNYNYDTQQVFINIALFFTCHINTALKGNFFYIHGLGHHCIKIQINTYTTLVGRDEVELVGAVAVFVITDAIC